MHMNKGADIQGSDKRQNRNEVSEAVELGCQQVDMGSRKLGA